MAGADEVFKMDWKWLRPLPQGLRIARHLRGKQDLVCQTLSDELKSDGPGFLELAYILAR